MINWIHTTTNKSSSAKPERDNKVIMKIVQSFVDRSRKDIDKWRQALQMAELPEKPRRYALQFLYRDMIIDLHLSSQIMIRKLAVLSKKFMIVNAKGEEDKDLTKLFEKPWFYKFISKSLDEIFYGTTLIELGDMADGEFKDIAVIPRTNVIPEEKSIITKIGEDSKFSYDLPQFEPWLIEIGDSDSLGLLSKLAPQVIWKRNAMQAWAEFMEKFGMPFRFAKTASRDQKDIDRIEVMLEKMGSAAYGVFPQGTEIDFKDGKGSDGGSSIFDNMVERCNSEMSKVINGIASISDQKSSGFKPELQAGVKEEITESDMRFIEFLVNYKLLPKLIQHGYALKDKKWQFDMTESLGRNEQWAIVKEALQYYNIPAEWISATFGFPIDSEKQLQNPVPENFLNALPKNMTLKEHGLFNSGHCCSPIITASAEKNVKEWLNEVESLYPKIFDNSLDAQIPTNTYFKAANHLMNGFKSGFKDRLENIQYDSPDNLKIAMYEANIHRFAAAKTFKDVIELNKLAAESKNFNEFKTKAENYVKVYSESYLHTEFSTAEATAQNAANWLRQADEADKYDLQYQTAGDRRVRPKHQEFDGFKAATTDPVWNWLYPPNDWNCRCEVIQIPKMKDRTHSFEVNRQDVNKNFRFNKGKTNFIFEAGHAYFKEFPDEKNLGFKKYGLFSYDGFDFSKYQPLNTTINSSMQFRDWWESEIKRLGKDKNDIYYTNYFGVDFRIQKDTILNKFQKQKYSGQNRYGIAQFVEDILQNPNEVWISTNKSNRASYKSVYLKRFKDGLYAVITGTDNEINPEIITWYKVNDLSNDSLGKIRHGILIKKGE